MDLQPILSIIPRYFPRYPFKFAGPPDTIEWLEPRRIETSLKIHVLDVEVHLAPALNALDGEVEPGAEPSVFVVGHRVARQPDVEVVAAVHLLAAGHVAGVEVAGDGYFTIIHLKFKCRTLGISLP